MQRRHPGSFSMMWLGLGWGHCPASWCLFWNFLMIDATSPGRGFSWEDGTAHANPLRKLRQTTRQTLAPRICPDKSPPGTASSPNWVAFLLRRILRTSAITKRAQIHGMIFLMHGTGSTPQTDSADPFCLLPRHKTGSKAPSCFTSLLHYPSNLSLCFLHLTLSTTGQWESAGVQSFLRSLQLPPWKWLLRSFNF